MLRDLQRSLVAMVVITALLGFGYPAVVWAVGQAAFHHQAQGSLVERKGTVVGSSLLGQGFKSARYFQPRPSAVDYDASASAASNLGPNSKELADAVRVRLAAVARTDGVPVADVPVDLVTASGSGLDPDISKDGALIQIDRVAKARNLSVAKVQALVLSHVDTPTVGLLGATRVNVLDLNLALDALH
jgi:potassium-transporting ATPase KdpC subunit